jgi:hypothetical protein
LILLLSADHGSAAAAGKVWTKDTSVGAEKAWRGITSSDDGTKLAATVSGGNIWTSIECPAGNRHTPVLCVPWTNCAAGEKMTQEGTATTDRQCAAEAVTSGSAVTTTASAGTNAAATTAIVISSLIVASCILGACIYYQYHVKSSRKSSPKDIQLAKV